MNARTFYVLFCGFVFGILCRSFFNLGIAFSVFLIFLGAILFLLDRLDSEASACRTKFILAFFVLAAGVGMLRFDVSDYGARNPILEAKLNKEVTLRGTITDEPDERADSFRLVISLNSFVEGDKIAVTSGKILLVASLYPKFHYGDKLELRGRVTKPKVIVEDSGRLFDYPGFLAKEGIYYQVNRAQISLISSGEGNFIKKNLFALKDAFLAKVGTVIPEPHASLLGGLIVGAKRSLGDNLLLDFRRAGVIHIVVLSGYNITIVAESVMKFFSFLPWFFGQAFGALSIILFAIMTGGSATVVRASIMALLVIFAKTLSRRYDIKRALLFAGLIMVIQNPKILVFDSSFQLSFMSTLALIYVSPLIEKHFSFVTEKFGLRGVLVATLATQIFVLPMLLYKMRQLSLVALPVNLLILSAIPATMLFGFLTGTVGFISTVLAFPFAFVAYGLLAYELKVVEFFSHLPFSSVSVSSFPLWFAVLVYLLYLLIYLRFHKQPAHRKFDKAKISASLETD